jgi:hypothetical protein
MQFSLRHGFGWMCICASLCQCIHKLCKQEFDGKLFYLNSHSICASHVANVMCGAWWFSCGIEGTAICRKGGQLGTETPPRGSTPPITYEPVGRASKALQSIERAANLAPKHPPGGLLHQSPMNWQVGTHLPSPLPGCPPGATLSKCQFRHDSDCCYQTEKQCLLYKWLGLCCPHFATCHDRPAPEQVIWCD